MSLSDLLVWVERLCFIINGRFDVVTIFNVMQSIRYEINEIIIFGVGWVYSLVMTDYPFLPISVWCVCVEFDCRDELRPPAGYFPIEIIHHVKQQFSWAHPSLLAVILCFECWITSSHLYMSCWVKKKCKIHLLLSMPGSIWQPLRLSNTQWSRRKGMMFIE